MTQIRQVFMVLSPRSLSYARDALESLFHNSLEVLRVCLITDSERDKQELSEAVASLCAKAHRWQVYSEKDLADREEELFKRHSNLRAFRHGHPCWRKITDPLLLSEPGAEMVLLDPDLYFPNRFKFEETPQNGLLLMWQRFHCLFPPDVVRTAMEDGIRLAHHGDIGVAHWRASADLDWLDWLVGRLGGTNSPAHSACRVNRVGRSCDASRRGAPRPRILEVLVSLAANAGEDETGRRAACEF